MANCLFDIRPLVQRISIGNGNIKGISFEVYKIIFHSFIREHQYQKYKKMLLSTADHPLWVTLLPPFLNYEGTTTSIFFCIIITNKEPL